jgi:fused glycosyl transferase and transpeptidase
LTGASGALQIYKDYLNRVVIEKLKLGQPSTIKWVGINAYGSWSCGSNRTIPVWANKDQNFCASAQTTSTATATAAQTTQSPQPEQPESPKPESVWDVLDNKAPVEEAAPAQ